MAESNRKWTGEQLGQSDDRSDKDLRENSAEMTENDLKWLEMTWNNIYQTLELKLNSRYGKTAKTCYFSVVHEFYTMERKLRHIKKVEREI